MQPKKTFVVTGGSSSIGREFVRQMSAQPNADILVTTRRSIEFSRDKCQGKLLHLSDVDLLNASDLQRLRVATEEFARGRFHVINCVGYFPGFKKLSDTSLDLARKVYESNVLTVYSTASVLLPLMAQRGGGHFIAFSSHAVPQAYPLMSAFTSAKAAVESLVRSIANEFGRHGVTASALALATIDSCQERTLAPGGDFEHWLETGQVSEIIDTLTTSVSPAVNGNTLQVYNYSETYFGRSFYDRIGRNIDGDK